MPDAMSVAEVPGFGQFPLGEGTGLRRIGGYPVAELIVRAFQQERGIYAAGKRHRKRRTAPQKTQQFLIFCLGFN